MTVCYSKLMDFYTSWAIFFSLTENILEKELGDRAEPDYGKKLKKAFQLGRQVSSDSP